MQPQITIDQSDRITMGKLAREIQRLDAAIRADQDADEESPIWEYDWLCDRRSEKRIALVLLKSKYGLPL